MVKRLIPDFEELDERSFGDLYVMYAKNLEDAMLETGAIPGEDYTRLDLFKMAEPYVLERVRTDPEITYTKKWKVTND